jgi:hypothetical protein
MTNHCTDDQTELAPDQFHQGDVMITDAVPQCPRGDPSAAAELLRLTSDG